MSIYIETYKQPGNRRRGENDDGRPQTDTGLAFYDAQRLLLLLPAEIRRRLYIWPPPSHNSTLGSFSHGTKRNADCHGCVCIDLTRESHVCPRKAQLFAGEKQQPKWRDKRIDRVETKEV